METDVNELYFSNAGPREPIWVHPIDCIKLYVTLMIMKSDKKYNYETGKLPQMGVSVSQKCAFSLIVEGPIPSMFTCHTYLGISQSKPNNISGLG